MIRRYFGPVQYQWSLNKVCYLALNDLIARIQEEARRNRKEVFAKLFGWIIDMGTYYLYFPVIAFLEEGTETRGYYHINPLAILEDILRKMEEKMVEIAEKRKLVMAAYEFKYKWPLYLLLAHTHPQNLVNSDPIWAYTPSGEDIEGYMVSLQGGIRIPYFLLISPTHIVSFDYRVRNIVRVQTKYKRNCFEINIGNERFIFLHPREIVNYEQKGWKGDAILLT